MRARVAVLVGTRGRGSNMAALVQSGRGPDSPWSVEVVVAPGPGSPASATARELGVPVEVVPKGPGFARHLLGVLRNHRADIVCLAGLMFLLPEEVVEAYPRRVLNIHPALLPQFGGKGMYGHHVHEAVVAAGAEESGCTVHYVTGAYDDGDVVLQKTYRLAPGETAESLAAAVLRLEHEAYPEAVTLVARDLR